MYELNANLFQKQMETAINFIKSNDNFLVVSHIHPDGDATSSTYAMGYILKKLNKKFILINEHIVPSKFDFLKNNLEIMCFSDDIQNEKFNSIISVDCGDLSRIGKVNMLLDQNYQLLNIDHHHTNDGFGNFQLINSNSASTVQIIYALYLSLNIELELSFFTCIYTGLMTDTGGFRYPNTSDDVLQLAVDLTKKGVNGSDISYLTLESLSKSQILLLQRTLPTLHFSHSDRIAWMSVSYHDILITNASYEDLEGLVQYPRNIFGVEVGILFKEMEPGKIKVSLRSQKYVDVSKIAKTFGGGGHIRAAGCQLQGNLNDVIQLVSQVSGLELT